MIKPDRILTLNVKFAAEALLDNVKRGGLVFPRRREGRFFLLGNIKARQRMVAQCTLARAVGGHVIGKDHAAETRIGFFTKFGDGAADILPFAGLSNVGIAQSLRV